MSDTVKLWIFILLLPFLAAIGHDFYANYLADAEKKAQLESLNFKPDEYMASDLGYVFVTYTPEFYENIKSSVSEHNWNKFAEPVLQQYTWAVALAPLGIFLLGFALVKVAGLLAAPRRRAKLPQDDPFLRHEKQETFKYKRR